MFKVLEALRAVVTGKIIDVTNKEEATTLMYMQNNLRNSI